MTNVHHRARIDRDPRALCDPKGRRDLRRVADERLVERERRPHLPHRPR
jgi:hypothetical protein